MRRVVVTGLGIVSSIGNNASEERASLRVLLARFYLEDRVGAARESARVLE